METEFTQHLELILGNKFNDEVKISGSQALSGGCINNAKKLTTTKGNFFIKTNIADVFPGMFDAEAKGLKLLAETNTVYIPNIIATGEYENKSYIILEFVAGSPPKKDFWKSFGQNLATLHKNSNKYFGLDHDNYIGSLVQKNIQTENWITFFITQRLQVQLDLAVNRNNINPPVLNLFEKLFIKLPELIIGENPSLLHGDLWSGNFMINSDGEATLIDPAVYYGHREVDLAMTKLFGGFNKEFYESYNEEWPLEKNYSDRLDIYNLYPLLVHVNLFGGGYLEQVKSILRKFL